MDKEDSPAESNESDSEEAAVYQEEALAEKEKVNKKLYEEYCKKITKEKKRNDPFLKQIILLFLG